MNLKKNLTSKSKRKTFPRAWNTASWSVKSNFLKRRWKITSLSFWFAQDFRDWTVLVMYIPITPINSICSTFDFASTACSFVIVTYTVVGHITICETWKVEVNNFQTLMYLSFVWVKIILLTWVYPLSLCVLTCTQYVHSELTFQETTR